MLNKYLIFVLIAIEGIGCTPEFESLGCKEVESKLATLRLKRHLFCDYDPLVRPTSSLMIVGVRFIPVYVNFNEHSNSLNFHTWLLLSWDDPHLHWNPDDFEKVDLYHAKTHDIWTPDFSVFNSGDLGTDQSLPTSDCVILHNGTIQCAIAQVYTSHCPADFSNWPYDEHNCTLHFGSWMHFSHEVDFILEEDGIMMHEFVENYEWDVKINRLTKASEIYKTDISAMIFMNVIVRRNPTRSSVVFITPMIIMIILTLTVLYLDSRSFERIAVACCNFICHLICLFDFHWYMPSNGAISTPKIVIFYEASIGLAAFTLIFTSIIRKIYSIHSPAPQFIASITSLIINCPASSYLGINVGKRKSQLVTNEDIENEERETSVNDRVWLDCASILEWLAFVTVFLTYVILLGILLPKSPPHPVEKYIY